jgi:hypothetical protein
MSDNRWQATLAEIDRLRDKLGRSLDPGSRELVACLRLLGIHTVMSCEGHADRKTEGPYVMFSSAQALPLENQYRELVQVGKSTDEEAKKIRDEAFVLNLRERQKLTPLLEKFYQQRPTPYDNRIIITTYGAGGSRLKCQAAEEYRLTKDRELFLKAHQQEFDAFTDFLKLHLKAEVPVRPKANGNPLPRG